MDHSNVDVKVKQEDNANSDYDEYITEDGKRYRVPYKIIKEVTFTELSKQELIDIPHAARLQYRLMLLDPIIKARVDYTKAKITIIFNPREADNIREKMSFDEVKDFLAKQGIHVDEKNTKLEDYDYYKNFYTYAYNPPSIRERAPYAYTKEEWQKMKPAYEEKLKEGEKAKIEKFKKFQEDYLATNPEMAPKIVEGYKAQPVEVKKGMLGNLFAKKKKQSKEKGFWFHGV